MAKILIASEDYAALEQVAAVVAGIGHDAIQSGLSLNMVDDVISMGIDLVVLDEIISPYSGLETCEMLREDPSVPARLPILLMVCRDIDVRVLEEKCVSDVFTKNFASIELEALLLNHLGDKAGRVSAIS